MNEREILNESIDAHQKFIDEDKAKLEALDKPKLRHGDLWVNNSGNINCFVKEYNDEMRDCVLLADFVLTNIGSTYMDEPIIGNIKDYFDDLKRNAEDLQEFRVANKKVDMIKGNGWFEVERKRFGEYKIWCPSIRFGLEKLTEIHQKLGQLIATARRTEK